MVAPLIAGAARLGGKAVSRAGGTRRGIRAKTAANKNRPPKPYLRLVADEAYAQEDAQAQYEQTQKNLAFEIGRLTGKTIARTALKVRTARTVMMLSGVTMSWYFFGQLTLYFAGLAFIAMGTVDFSLFGIVLDLIGLDLIGDAFVGAGLGLNLLNLAICWTLMAGMWLVLYLTGVHSLSGKMSFVKFILFLLALIGYSATFFQFLPWAIPWLWIVARYPE